MPYDEQGNFYGSNEDLGALEAKYTKPDLASQIPGQVSSSKPDTPKTMREMAVAALMQANPLMMKRSFEDVTKTLVGGAALPVVAPVSAGVQYLNALPGNMLRRSRGEQEVQTPSAEDLMRKYGEVLAPTTQVGQSFQENMGKLMDTLKVPAAWPTAPNVPKRALLTPTDVRVGAGQIKQLTKELQEVPQDFQNAQSGLKRQNLYGEDTLGVKIQAAADSLGDTLERRRTAGLATIPGVPGALVPETNMYAVRPKGSRLVQAKVPESAKGYRPEEYTLDDIVEEVYGDTPAAQMPPEMILEEYSNRYLPTEFRGGADLRRGVAEYVRAKAQQMFPDASSPEEAMRAYRTLYSNRTEGTKQQLAEIEEFLNLPENAAYRETIPTPSEFMQRMAEAERVIKGPFTTFISKNVGTEGDPTVKLARQGITYNPPEVIQEMEKTVNTAGLAEKRRSAGFPAMGSFHEERLAKTGELDRLNEEIEALEQIRQPLFSQAQAESIDPASIPEFAETTNPLRQKLRQREQLQEELENIKLATSVENISDAAVGLRTKAQMLGEIPFAERQFFPSVTKAGENEKFYRGKRDQLVGLGFEKLGRELREDILTGKAGDTSKLTIENYMREKGLTRIEAEKAAKLQEQQYRTNLQNILLERIRNDQTVQTFGNAAIITLDQNTPSEVAMRDMSADTTVLDHCVGQCGTAPKGRKNILTGKQQQYEPVIDPITGERSVRGVDTSYVSNLQRGHELVSVRDTKTGLPAATLQFVPAGSGQYAEGKFNIGYASGAKNGAVDPAYINAIKDYLNSRSDSINSPGEDLVDHMGLFDLKSPNDWRRVTNEAGLTKDQARALDFEAGENLPRFVTVDDIRQAAKGSGSRALVPATREQGPVARLELQDHDAFTEDLTRALENSFQSIANFSDLPAINRAAAGALDRNVARIFETYLNDPVEFVQDPVARLLRAEQDLQNVIDTSFASPREVDTALGLGLTEFLTDLRGIRGNIERRLPVEQAPQVQGARQVARLEGFEMPDNLDAGDLLMQHGNRMSTRQREWLEDFQRRWDRDIGRGGARQGLEEEMIDEYDDWLSNNRLEGDPRDNILDDIGDFEPDPTAVANAPDVFALARRYNIPPVTVRELQTRFNNPEATVAQLSMLRAAAQLGAQGSIFETLPQEARGGAARMIAEEIQGRREQAGGREVAPQVPQIQVQDAVPREVQAMNRQDMVLQLGPIGVDEARRIAQQYFDTNVFNENARGVSAAASAIRDYNFGPHEGQSHMVRELAARMLEDLNTTARQDAVEIAHTLNDAFYSDMFPEDAYTAISRDIVALTRYGEDAWEDIIGPMAETFPWSRNLQEYVIEGLRNYLRELGDGEGGLPADNPPRRGPFQPGGAAAVRGVPLGNLNIRPAITAEALRGPDSQPIRNFLQQVKGLPGVTQEGLTTGLMAFEKMDPNTRMTKAQFVRELLPSSYDIVDLKNTATNNQHIREIIEEGFIDDQSQVGDLLGLSDEYIDLWSEALAEHGTDFNLYPAKLKRALAKEGIKNAKQYNKAYDAAYQAAIEQGIDDYRNYHMMGDEDGYMYGGTQRLVETNMGDQYGEFGVVHPDQRGRYKHYDEAPEGTMGHFRGTYNPADPITLSTFGDSLTPERIKQLNKTFKKAFNDENLSDNDKLSNLKQLVSKPDFTSGDAHYLNKYIDDNMDEAFEWTEDNIIEEIRGIVREKVKKANVETKPGSYVIEEIQSDAQKNEKQKGHLHQAHGILFKAAIQKGLELGANTIYLPTGEVIAKARNQKISSFAPIYDQAIVKEGLKPLLKIPGVTSKMFNGYHEISFTPEAKEYVLNGPGQTIPGYAKGGMVKKKPSMALVVTRKNPELAEMAYRYGGMVR